MRRNLFYVLVLFMALSLNANATISVSEQTDPERVINEGYSEATAEQIMIQKSRMNGEPAEPLYEQKCNNKFVRFCKSLYGYIDPAQDGNYRYHHNIETSPSHRDL